MVIPATRNIGISQLKSSSMPNARLLDTAPNLPKHTIMHTAAADTCVGKTLTATLVITKFAVAAIRENTHAVIRICSEDLTKYIAKPAMPATSIVVTGGKKPSEILFLLKKDKPKKLWIVVASSVYLLNNTAVLKIKNYSLLKLVLTRHCSTTDSIY